MKRKIILNYSYLLIQIIVFILYLFVFLFSSNVKYPTNLVNGNFIRNYLFMFLPVILFLPWVGQEINIYISGFLFIFFCAFRSTLSVDDWNYSQIFYLIKDSWNNLWVRPEEKGYLIINKIISFFVSDYQQASIIILGIAIILFIIAVRLWTKYVNSYFLITHYFFFLLFRFTIVGLNRIQFAVPIFLIMLYFLMKEEYKKGIIFFILGCSIHLSFLTTFIVFLPILFRKYKTNFLANIGILLAIAFAFPIVIFLMLKILPSVKYSGYTDYFSLNISAFSIILLLLIFYFILNRDYIVKDLNNNYVNYYMLMYSLILGTYFQIFFSATAVGRVSYYLLFSIPLLFGEIKSNETFFYNKYISFISFTVIEMVYFIVTQMTDPYLLSLINNYENILLS